MRSLIFVLFLVISFGSLGQKPDSIPLLLLDTEIQIESTDGINSMYNFDFLRADSQFRWLRGKYSWHPLPYFLLGLSQWWRIMPNLDETKYDKTFLVQMDSAILLAQNIFNKGSEVEGGFFLSAAHAFKGRLYAERRNWTKAASEGKKALQYLEYCRGKEEFGPEIMFGDALYNYYAEWIPENYPILKPVMIFFEDGNKELGLKQLKEVANNAFFTRTEAQYFLMRIEADEGDKKNALFISEYLHQTFPNNAYFHRYYARQLYASGLYTRMEPVCHSIMNKIDSAYVGYEAHSGRYATFFLGQMYSYKDELEEAKKSYQLAIKYGEEIGAEKMGYHLHSLLSLGEIAIEREEFGEAEKYLKQVRKLSPKKSNVNKQAKKMLKSIKSAKKA